jgi:hypothetical protein
MLDDEALNRLPKMAAKPTKSRYGAMAEPVKHRKTKEAATRDIFDLRPPRHISTLP